MRAPLRLALLAVLSLTGCDRTTARADPTPEQTVRAYFTAMAAHDCDGITRLSGGKLAADLAKHGCAEAFHTFEEHGVKLDRIDKTQQDGRFADTSLVTVVLRQGDKDKRVVVGVKRIGGHLLVTQL